jgi:hypothetical protein
MPEELSGGNDQTLDASEVASVVFKDYAIEVVLDKSASIVRDVLESQWRKAKVAQTALALQVIPPPTPCAENVEVMCPLPAPPADVVLDTLDEVVDALKTGREISGLRDRISQLITNQESRAELVSSMAMAHDFGRLARYMRARASLEDILLTASIDRTLTPTQSLAFLKIAQEQSEVILSRVRAGATNIQDLMALLNKADYALQVQDAALAKKFSNTTPQGREIIRRLAHRLNKMSASTAEARGNKVEDHH